MFVPWTQTITATGQLSAYSPYERPQDIEAQIIGRIKKWHVFEGVRVKQGELILELEYRRARRDLRDERAARAISPAGPSPRS